MALTSAAGLDAERLLDRIRETYQRVAADPRGEFHFHRGPEYAAKHLNYSVDDLAGVPAGSAQRFAGVGNPHRIGAVRRGEIVLDHACGAGQDVIIAARRVGQHGRVIGVDMTKGMLDHAWRNAMAAGMDDRASLFHGVYEALPVDDASVDVVISNGALNLAVDKRQVFAEILRVLKPGGRLHLADVVVQGELAEETRLDPDLWAACIAGALQETELLELAATAGFSGCRITERFDCFCGAAAEYRVSRSLQIGAVNFFARKPGI